jgi:GT2 family glycosyltransferase
MIQLTGSIVLYQNKRQIVKQAIESFLDTNLPVKLFLIDNSPSDKLRDLSLDPRIEYFFNNDNLGFGKAHNIAINKSFVLNSKYHLVLNPDVYFNAGTLERIFEYMEGHQEAGLILPKVLYPDGELQYLCKILPTPFDLFLRRFLKFKYLQDKWNNKYELRFANYDRIMNIPYLSGCFMFFRNEALKKVGLFDENIFMYMEDTDITRRIHKKFKTLFYPEATIYHYFEKGSHKTFKLAKISIESSIKYFNKWGWFFDKERRDINKRILEELNYKRNKY